MNRSTLEDRETDDYPIVDEDDATHDPEKNSKATVGEDTAIEEEARYFDAGDGRVVEDFCCQGPLVILVFSRKTDAKLRSYLCKRCRIFEKGSMLTAAIANT